MITAEHAQFWLGLAIAWAAGTLWMPVLARPRVRQLVEGEQRDTSSE